MRTDDPDYVRRQYATEEGLRARAAIYGSSARDARDVIVDEIRASGARAVLEVGCGWGDLALRLESEAGARVTATDLSPRMVELARTKGLDATVADVQNLPFADASFDAVVAAWMLYHVPDLDRGLAEIARVLRPGGTLVATTNAVSDMHELWELVGRDLGPRSDTFRLETGDALLRPRFPDIRRHDVITEVSFATLEAIRDYVGSTEHGRALVDRVPRDLPLPFVVSKRIAVFVAAKPARRE